MSLVIKVGGETYLPLRAVPIVTSALLNTPTLAAMISDPESYCNAEHDTILSVYSFRPSGSLIEADYWSFAALRSKSSRESAIDSSRHLAAGMLVQRDKTRQMFDLIVHEVGRAHPGRVKPEQTIWDENPQLPPQALAFIMEGLPKQRLNSAVDLRARILDIVQDVTRLVAPHGITIDTTAMPGTRASWSALITELVPEAARSPATHADHFSALRLTWRSGSRPEQINPIREALGLKLI